MTILFNKLKNIIIKTKFYSTYYVTILLFVIISHYIGYHTNQVRFLSNQDSL